jgi:23S rRNA pseudouridine1911/1915/1917 synthase
MNQLSNEKNNPSIESYLWQIEKNCPIVRLDKYITEMLPTFSRSFLQKAIADGYVKVDEVIVLKPSTPIKKATTIELTLPSVQGPTEAEIASATKQIEIVYQHEHFFIINKPAGLTVHRPYQSSSEITVVDWLLQNKLVEHTLGDSARPGIVHRLDKNTSGLLIIARTPYGQAHLAKLFHDRLIKKTYIAIVQGHPEPAGSVELFIGRDPHLQTRMKSAPFALNHTFRHALTHFKVLQYLKNCSVVQVNPITGRTHQIRVHMAALGYPLIGDTVYGKPHPQLNRHALHAHAIEFMFDQEQISVQIEPPTDIKITSRE